MRLVSARGPWALGLVLAEPCTVTSRPGLHLKLRLLNRIGGLVLGLPVIPSPVVVSARDDEVFFGVLSASGDLKPVIDVAIGRGSTESAGFGSLKEVMDDWPHF